MSAGTPNHGPYRWLLTQIPARRGALSLIGVLVVAAVAATVTAPLAFARVIDVLFAGAVGRSMPAGADVGATVADLRARGDEALANIVERAAPTPGSGVDYERLVAAIGVVAGLYLVVSLSMWAQGRLINRIAQRTMNGLRKAVAEKLHRLPAGYFDRNAHGQTMSKVSGDIDNVAAVFTPLLVTLPSALLTVLALLAVMPTISAVLTLVVVTAVPISLLVGTMIARSAKPEFEAQWAALGTLTAYMHEQYELRPTLQAANATQRSSERFAALNAAHASAMRRATTRSGLTAPVMTAIAAATTLAVVVVGALQMFAGSLSLGQVQAFGMYAAQFNRPAMELSGLAAKVQSAGASLRRVRTFLDESDELAPAIDDPDPPERRAGKHERPPSLIVADVGFGYPADTDDAPGRVADVLADVSINIPAGASVAVIGPTGAGKSTLMNLLLRLDDPDRGRILVDGEPITRMPRSRLRARSAVVTQDSWLFEGTVEENIAFGLDAGLSSEERHKEVRRAASLSRADRIIEALPDGYQSSVGGSATALSAGEIQLLTIARAAAVRPNLLIMDEATSSVDPQTEMDIRAGLQHLRESTTTIIVAHRLSTIRDADLIVVLDGGRIDELGSHTTLMARRGSYWNMLNAADGSAADELSAAAGGAHTPQARQTVG